VAKDLEYRIMSGKSSDGDRESAYHYYMSKSKDVNLMPKNLMAEQNQSLIERSIQLSASFKDLENVSVLDKRQQEEILLAARKKLRCSDSQLPFTKRSGSTMLITEEHEPRPINKTYCLSKAQDGYAFNRDLREQIKHLYNPERIYNTQNPA